MDKKLMNKMDDMELDMVVGGRKVFLVTRKNKMHTIGFPKRCKEENKMDKNFMNKMDNMEMDKVSGGKISPWHPKAPRPRPG